MKSLCVPNRGGILWFVLGWILLCLAVLVARIATGSKGWVGAALIGGLAAAVFTYALYGAIRSIDLGDEIVVRYCRRERVVPWSEAAFVIFDRTETRFRTGIPFVTIPTENHTMTLHFHDGATLKADIEPRFIPCINEVLKCRMAPDRERERSFREARAATERKWNRLLWVAIGLICLLEGIWFVATMRERVFDGSSSTGWPTAPATILQAGVVPRESTDRNGRKETSYFPAVEYTYRVGGKLYTGRRIGFWDLGSSEPDTWQELVDRFRFSQPPTIRYKPSDPSVCVVIAGADELDVMITTGAGFAAVGGLAFALVNLVKLVNESSEMKTKRSIHA